MMLVDEQIQELIEALQGQNDFDPLGEVEPQSLGDEVELDPVARITQDAGTPEPLTPIDVTQSQPAFAIDNDPRTNEIGLGASAGAGRSQGAGVGGSAGASRQRVGVGAKAGSRMTTGDFALKMLAKEGTEYEWGGTRRSTGWDCSGIIYRIMQNAGHRNFPRVSGDIYAHSKKISLEKAIKTRGAILWTEGHIAVSLGNGKTIEARGEDYGVVIATAHGRFTGGGLLPELKVGKTIRELRKAKKTGQPFNLVSPQKRAEINEITTSSLVSAPMVFGNVIDEIEDPMRFKRRRTQSDVPVKTKGIKGQLYAGFMEAGRPDLAKMVFTEDFNVWIGRESGWRPGVVSPANNQGRPNGGLFQFWEGHEWAQRFFKSGKFQATPYQQAVFAATHFDLSAQDIRNYADAIRNDTYKGWG